MRQQKTLVGLPACQVNRLQCVPHVATQLVHGARTYDHVTRLLWELHWLSILERIILKLATLVFRCLRGTAPVCLGESLIEQLTMNVDADCAPALNLYYKFDDSLLYSW